MSRVADMAGVRVSLEKGEGREAILLLEGFPQGCRRARGIIQVSHNNGIIYYHYLLVNLSWSICQKTHSLLIGLKLNLRFFMNSFFR